MPNLGQIKSHFGGSDLEHNKIHARILLNEYESMWSLFLSVLPRNWLFHITLCTMNAFLMVISIRKKKSGESNRFDGILKFLSKITDCMAKYTHYIYHHFHITAKMFHIDEKCHFSKEWTKTERNKSYFDSFDVNKSHQWWYWRIVLNAMCNANDKRNVDESPNLDTAQWLMPTNYSCTMNRNKFIKCVKWCVVGFCCTLLTLSIAFRSRMNSLKLTHR